jgi:enoyl-CoA hydratase/carnithine racemase
MSETRKLLLEKDGAIGWIIFNQPEKRNAVSQEMWQLMPEYVNELAQDDAIRVVILRGAGEQAFVAGADISQFQERRRNMADEQEYSKISAQGQASLTQLGKPLLAMIYGYCIGGGVGIAITCDLRIAADDARFGIPAARLGLGYHYNGMEKLLKLIGPAYTKEIFFTARTDFSAQDAWRMGLVNQVVPKAELEAFTRDYALRMAHNAPLTLRSAKANVDQLLRPPEQRELARLDQMLTDCFNSQDYQEGVRAFAEKRRPQFQGR